MLKIKQKIPPFREAVEAMTTIDRALMNASGPDELALKAAIGPAWDFVSAEFATHYLNSLYPDAQDRTDCPPAPPGAVSGGASPNHEERQ